MARGGGRGKGWRGNPPGLDFGADLERLLSGYQRDADVARAQAGEQRQLAFNETFDPNNPFSMQALLDREHKRALGSTALSFGDSMGGIYSGARERVEGDVAFTGSQEQDRLLRDYLGRLGGIERELGETVGGASRASEEAIFNFAQGMADDIEATSPEAPWRKKKKGKGKGKGKGGGGGRNMYGPAYFSSEGV